MDDTLHMSHDRCMMYNMSMDPLCHDVALIIYGSFD